jgi:hypothetical protein
MIALGRAIATGEAPRRVGEGNRVIRADDTSLNNENQFSRFQSMSLNYIYYVDFSDQYSLCQVCHSMEYDGLPLRRTLPSTHLSHSDQPDTCSDPLVRVTHFRSDHVSTNCLASMMHVPCHNHRQSTSRQIQHTNSLTWRTAILPYR